MAGAAKRTKVEDEESVAGYLHSLSPLEVSKKNARYFDATLQSGREEYHRVVVFSTEKRQIFEQAAIAKKPVKLTRVKRTISFSDPGGYDIVCSASSGLEVSQNVGFFF
ncbi:unnamed protein product [Merluccius merluccius]